MLRATDCPMLMTIDLINWHSSNTIKLVCNGTKHGTVLIDEWHSSFHLIKWIVAPWFMYVRQTIYEYLFNNFKFVWSFRSFCQMKATFTSFVHSEWTECMFGNAIEQTKRNLSIVRSVRTFRNSWILMCTNDHPGNDVIEYDWVCNAQVWNNK